MALCFQFPLEEIPDMPVSIGKQESRRLHEFGPSLWVFTGATAATMVPRRRREPVLFFMLFQRFVNIPAEGGQFPVVGFFYKV